MNIQYDTEQERRYRIIIVGAPERPEVRAESAIVTQKAQFTCSSLPQFPDNPETILYTWTKDGKDIGFNNETTGEMEINPVDKSHAGNYDCKVTNVAGHSSAGINFIVYCE